jgi:hypothetical protein
MEALYYYGQCQMLINRALSFSEPFYDENWLATIVCIRMCDAIEQPDGVFHPKDTDNRFLDLAPTFANSGGLAGATAWCALRQDIHMSLCSKLPPRIDLNSYRRSQNFEFSDDSTCANIIIFILAVLLRLLYSKDKSVDCETWEEVETDVKSWDSRRSDVFQPLVFEEAGSQQTQPFPVLKFGNSAQGEYTPIMPLGWSKP